MMSLSGDKEAEIMEAFNSVSRHLDDLFNIDNTYFDGMVNQIYPSELQLNKAVLSVCVLSHLVYGEGCGIRLYRFVSVPGRFYTPPQKSGGVLCYSLRTVLSVCPSVRQRFVSGL